MYIVLATNEFNEVFFRNVYHSTTEAMEYVSKMLARVHNNMYVFEADRNVIKFIDDAMDNGEANIKYIESVLTRSGCKCYFKFEF